jgi:hydrogenase maturation protease
MIRIIGIGAPFGDDAVGLEAARILAEQPPPGCEVIAADRPGAGLIELLDEIEAAILIDAVRSGAPLGTIHELSFAQLARYSGRFVSSHELGVAASVQLARELGCAPAQGGMLGIEVAAVPSDAPYLSLSPDAIRAVSAVLVRVRCWLEKLNLLIPYSRVRAD